MNSSATDIPAISTNDRCRSMWVEVEVWLLVALVWGVYFTRLSDLSIRGEEARWAQIGREMVRSGDWIVPRQQGVPFPDRPPLNSWLMALSSLLVGNWGPVAVRLPTVLAALVTTLIIYRYGRNFLSRTGAFAGAAAYATMGQIMQLCRLGESDSLLTCCMTAALLTWHAGYMREWPPVRTWMLGYAFTALAGLAKGPQGPVYFVGATGLYLLAQRDWKFLFSRAHLAGVLTFAFIVGLWQVPYFLMLDWEHVDAIWSEGGMSIAHRMAYDSIGQFLAHLVEYPAEVFGCMAPWSFMLLCYLGKPFRQSIGAARPYVLFLLTACAIAFPTCWLPVNSRPRFFVSLYPCVALLIGLAVERCREPRFASWWHLGWRRFSIGAAILFAVAGITFGTAQWWNTDPLSPLAQPHMFAMIYLLAAVVAAAVLVAAQHGASLKHFRAAIFTVAAFCGLTYTGIAVNYLVTSTNDIAGAVAHLKQQLPPGEKLVSYGLLHNIFTYHYQQPIEPRDWPEDGGSVVAEGTYFCYAENRHWGRHEPPFAWEKVAEIVCDRMPSNDPGDVVVVGKRVQPAATVARQAASKPR
jgi:4-amino-4-deoxy-L-arabinose transferase-like glycosyltransferase